MALRYNFLLVVFLLIVLVLILASGFRLKNPVHVLHMGDPLEKSLAYRVFSNTEVAPGRVAIQGQFPYQIRLFYYITPTLGYLCSGSLISQNYVLTSAHCVHERENNPNHFSMTAGEVNDLINTGYEQVLIPDLVIKHEGYNPTTNDNDIALLRTNQSFIFNDHVKPICIPQTGSTININTDGIITGWGKTNETGSTANVLQYTTVTVVSYAVCEDIFGLVAFPSHLKNDICATPDLQSQTSCIGNSGGPLAMTDSSAGQTWLAGIVSRGFTVCNDGTIYTKTSYYTTWITDNSGVVSCYSQL